MDIVSLCPLPATGFVYRSQAGTFAQTVVVKATYTLRPGEAVLAPAQEELNDEDNHWNDDPARSVYAPSDKAPYKPKADVMLVGHAFAPGGKTVRSLVARLVVGALDKAIEVFCDRAFMGQGQVIEGSPFTKMPLRWERAAGGPATNNPVGIRWDAPPDAYGRVLIPNLQPPGIHLSKRADTFPPICYAPVAQSWPSRMLKLGRHGGIFAAKGGEAVLLPGDLDYGYFQGAPADQQVSELRANERIVLEHLHPEHERLVSHLPGIRPRAIVDRATGEREEIQLAADTLWIDTDRGICTLVWRGRVGLRHAGEAGRVSVWVDGMAVQAKEEMEDGTITLVPRREVKNAPALPFGSGQAGEASLPPALPPAVAQRLGALANVPVDEAVGTIVASMEAPAKAPLPFGEVGGSGLKGLNEGIQPVSMSGARAKEWDSTGTIVGSVAPVGRNAGETLPFQAGGMREEPPLFVPAMVAPVAPIEEVVEAEDLTHTAVKVEKFVEVAPPPMIGPLGKGEEAPREDRPEAVVSAPPVEEKPVIILPVVEEKRREMSLEACAALTASIARRKNEEAKKLEDEGLSKKEWEDVKTYWDGEIQKELKRGKAELMRRFDEAYVQRLEAERGVIGVEEYARLSVGMERGMVDEVLRELDLPRGAVMRVERVWMGRFAGDLTFGDMVSKALDGARKE